MPFPKSAKSARVSSYFFIMSMILFNFNRFLTGQNDGLICTGQKKHKKSAPKSTFSYFNL